MALIDWQGVHGERDLHDVAYENGGKDGQPMPHGGLATRHEAHAIVNHGRWIAQCPFCDGAEYVDFGRPTFWCCSCRNASVSQHLVPLIWPSALNRAAIEAELMRRPLANRNWAWGEEIAGLQAENQAHGVK